MMIGPPNIDQQVIAARQLVAMIGDIGCEVGVLAVLFPDHTVLVVAERRRPEPEGTVLLEEIPMLSQPIESLCDCP